MSTAITFLSGKGGSGKTTLALSLGDLLRRCGIKTLLVDCDLSTNGATYFYESLLLEQNKNSRHAITSFSDIFKDLYELYTPYIDPVPLQINPKLDFIPSVSEISDQCLAGSLPKGNSDADYSLSQFIRWAKENYDVVLLDCQAGYSEFLPKLLPHVDVNLFVLEADSISASAMRSLHLKIGNYLGRARIFQVFNKATPEEFDIYSKITGTFFVNIGTMMFDWKIRQAFSRSQIPDFENNSLRYGLDLCSICEIIFPDKKMQSEIYKFSSSLLDKKLQEESLSIETKLSELRDKSNSSSVYMLAILAVSITLCIPILSSYIADRLKTDSSFLLPTLVLFAITVLLSTSIYLRQDVRKERLKYETQLKQLDIERKKLQSEKKQFNLTELNIPDR